MAKLIISITAGIAVLVGIASAATCLVRKHNQSFY